MPSLDPVNADLILMNGNIAALDSRGSLAQAAAVKDGRFLAVGEDVAIQAHRGPHSQVVDLRGHTAIPGLNDSHLHVIRGGLNYNMELRWDGVPSLADGLRMLKEQAQRTPPGQWVRVVGGWSEFQFAERRMPTLDEINGVAPETPVFILHLYCRALLNQAALRAAATRRTAQIRRAVKFSVTTTAIPLDFSSLARTRRFFTPHLPRVRSSRQSIN